MAGKFITVEGGEGCGKTTQARLLFAALKASGVPAVLTREPGGTAGAEEIRALLVTGATGRWDRLAETLLYSAARREHVEKLIKPALERGEWVICDRFSDSTHAYQGYGHGVSGELIANLSRMILGGFKPDLTLLFDMDTEKAITRARARENKVSGAKEDRYERMDYSFHENVRRGFLAIAGDDPERCAIIDADQSIMDIHRAAVSQARSRLGAQIDALAQPEIGALLRK